MGHTSLGSCGEGLDRPVFCAATRISDAVRAPFACRADSPSSRATATPADPSPVRTAPPPTQSYLCAGGRSPSRPTGGCPLGPDRPECQHSRRSRTRPRPGRRIPEGPDAYPSPDLSRLKRSRAAAAFPPSPPPRQTAAVAQPSDFGGRCLSLSTDQPDNQKMFQCGFDVFNLFLDSEGKCPLLAPAVFPHCPAEWGCHWAGDVPQDGGHSTWTDCTRSVLRTSNGASEEFPLQSVLLLRTTRCLFF